MRNILLFILLSTSILASAQSDITWGTGGSDIGAASSDNQHPRMAMDGSGNPLVIWGNTTEMAVYFSRWNGTAFTTPVKINPSWLHVDCATWQGPDIAAKGDTVYVVVRHMHVDSNCISIMHSFDGGISFSQPKRVDFIADSAGYYPAVAIDDNGNPIVSFMKYNSTGALNSARWVVSKSTDFGNTFLPDVRASQPHGSVDGVCDCCPSAVLASGNRSMVLYRDDLSDIRDIWMGMSNNGGVSFPNYVEVDNNNWNFPSCPSSGPDAVIVGDTVYSVFMSGGSGDYRVYLSKASVSTGAVSSVTALTGTIAGLTQQNFPRIERFGNAVAIVWKQNVNSQPQLPMLFTNNIANGFPATYDMVDVVNITNGDVAVGNGKVCAVWQDDNANTVKYRFGTFTPINTSVREIETNSLFVYPNPASSTLTLQTNMNLQNAEMKVLNVLGETVLQQTISVAGKTEINISQLAKGSYVVQVSSLQKRFVSKFVKE